MTLDNTITRPKISGKGREDLRKEVNRLQEHLPKLGHDEPYTMENAATHHWRTTNLNADELYYKAIAVGIKDFTPYMSTDRGPGIPCYKKRPQRKKIFKKANRKRGISESPKKSEKPESNGRIFRLDGLRVSKAEQDFEIFTVKKFDIS
jgi:hypothetical protein